jgi:hypothetical protein
MFFSDWLVSLKSPDAVFFWGLTLVATLALWLICIVKFLVSTNFEFPDNLYRVVLCDYSVFVFFFSTSKYTEDFPYLISFGTALVEYTLLSTWLSQLLSSVLCGCEPFSVGLAGLNYVIFIAGTAFNLSRSVWALCVVSASEHSSTTMNDMIPGRTSNLDTLWWSTAIAVTMSLLLCSYTTSRRARNRSQYELVPLPASNSSSSSRRTCCRC